MENHSSNKSKLSLRRKPGRKGDDFTGQRLSTKLLVAPKLKSSSNVPKTTYRVTGESESNSTSNVLDKCLGSSFENGGQSLDSRKQKVTGEELDRGCEVGKVHFCGLTVQEKELDFGISKEITGENSRGLRSMASSAAGEEGLGELFFCHICQKDLTRFDLNLRQAHLNRCCDETITGQGKGRHKNECVLCGKTFLNDNTRTQHMKSCARSRGLSTAQLIEKVRQTMSSHGPSSGEGMSASRQLSLRNLWLKTDEDFKQAPPPPSRTRRSRKKKGGADSLGDVEYEQLQLALAMSASLASSSDLQEERTATSEENRDPPPPGRRRKRKRTDPVHLPLLSASSQMCREKIALRAEQLLLPACGSSESCSDDISCTPAFGRSELVVGVVDAAPHTSGSDDQKLFLSEEEDDLNQVAHEPAEDGSGGPPRKESPFIISSVVVGDEQDAGISDSDRKRHGRTLLDSRKSPLESRVQATRSSSSLWQLGSSDFAGGSCGDFYVQALSTAITPAKTNPLYCKQCHSSPCLCLGVPSLPTAPKDQATPLRGVQVAQKNKLNISSSLSLDLGTMVNSPVLSDLTVLTRTLPSLDHTLLPENHTQLTHQPTQDQTSELCAHRCFLAARCSGFREVMEEDDNPLPNVLDLSQFDRQTVLQFLELVYTGRCQDKPEEEVEVIAEMMCCATAVSGITRHVSTSSPHTTEDVVSTSSPHTTEDVVSTSSPHTTEDVVYTALEPTGGDNCHRRASQEDIEDLNNARRHSYVLFSESPASSASEVGSPGGNDMVSPASVTQMSGDSDTTPPPTTPTPASPIHSAPPTPILVLSASTSPEDPSSRMLSHVEEQESSQQSFPSNVKSLRASSSEEFSFDLPTPTYISSNTPSPSSSQEVGHAGKAGHVFRSRSSSSDDLVLCGISHTQSLPETCEKEVGCEEDVELVHQRDAEMASQSLLNSANIHEWQDVVTEEMPEEVADEEERAVDAGIRRSMEAEDKRTSEDQCTSGLNDAPVLTAEDEELFYINDQFDPDWMMDVTDYCSATSTSQPPPSNISTLKPPPPAPAADAGAGAGARLGSLTQTPVPQQNKKRPASTPMSGGWSIVSNDNITPMPQYYSMSTPNLKKQGQKFGLRGLPKRKIITKLVEIYNYTHPLVAEDGSVVPEDVNMGDMETLKMRVKHSITSNHQLYQDILLYKPLELSYIQDQLKGTGVVMAKDKLMDILDFMCVTYTEPRNGSKKKHRKDRQT